MEIKDRGIVIDSMEVGRGVEFKVRAVGWNPNSAIPLFVTWDNCADL